MSIPRQIIDAIKDRTDIVELIGSRVTLKRAGSNYNGLCPFHSEKTPSFTVFPDTQHFFCFGCEAGGDAFTFIMRTENLEYMDAVRLLAQRAGIDLPEDDRKDPNAPQIIGRTRLYEMNKAAAKFFHRCLFDPEIGRAGMAYLKEKRGLKEDIIRHFGLGYAPNSSSALMNELKQQGYTEQEMKQGFLCGIGQYGSYDYFRDRVMFPVIDTVGHVVAFSGRDVGGESKAKYLNSSDTPGFSKRRNLFALNFAKNHCTDQLILCEGNMDVVSLHAAGFENAVASLGTALTDEQARIMTKYTKQVVIAYDSDAAGQHAAHRAMGIFAKVGLDVRILNMKDAKDPDEYIKKFGRDAFARLIRSSSTGFEFKLNSVLSRYDIKNPDERIKAANELCDIIAGIYSAAERDVYIQAVSEKLSLPAASLKTDVDRIAAQRRKEFMQKQNKDAQLSVMGVGDRINPDVVGSVAAASAEDTIVGLLLLYEEHRKAVDAGLVTLTADDFVTAFNKRAFEAVMELQRSDGGFEFSMLGERFTPDEMGRLTKLIQARRQLTENGTDVLRVTVDALKKAKAKKQDADADPMDRLARLLEEKRRKNAPKS